MCFEDNCIPYCSREGFSTPMCKEQNRAWMANAQEARPSPSKKGEVCMVGEYDELVDPSKNICARGTGMGSVDSYELCKDQQKKPPYFIHLTGERCVDVYKGDVSAAVKTLNSLLKNIRPDASFLTSTCPSSAGRFLLWVGSLFGSDALDVTDDHC